MLVGCGGTKSRGLKVEYVEGVVTLDGQPVPGASVIFHPVTPGGLTEPAGGYTNANGVYKLSSTNGDPERGAVAGDYVVTVEKIEIIDPNMARSYDEQVMLPSLPITEKHIVAEVYRVPATTPLKFTVTPGRNKIDLELKSSP